MQDLKLVSTMIDFAKEDNMDYEIYTNSSDQAKLIGFGKKKSICSTSHNIDFAFRYALHIENQEIIQEKSILEKTILSSMINSGNMLLKI